ncbi:anti-anti sigma factor [Bacillus sp. MUM 116]|uniref:anti-sigma factor antagonist n=1 Tax=Bacillus sp. MUM 116 TaxID=1678002 RepID=UPI0008F589C2|nr:anti-sigma factor antagonist [Bacillus sp. MUM 116]OIK16136.1 anti-anti sigma factor [Bacillus sp. MUM 116]
MNLKIDKHQNNEETFVKVAGEIDAYTAPQLREGLLPLAEGKNKTLIVSLKEVSYMDSTGLGVFIGLFKQLKKNEGELVLIDLSDRLKRLFEITGISNIIHISTE